MDIIEKALIERTEELRKLRVENADLTRKLEEREKKIVELRDIVKNLPCECGDGASFTCYGCRAKSKLDPDILGEQKEAKPK